MNEEEFRELEARCVQEQPPKCTSACPLHVDVRTFVREVRDREWAAARRTLNDKMPFPGILGRICDHPCEASCKRGEVGDTVAISALEKTCVSQSVSVRPENPFPPDGKQRIAVIGAGLSSLVASLDLVSKGFPITIFSGGERLGGSLWNLGEDTLPERVIAEETSLLTFLGVEVNTEAKLSTDLFQDILQKFDAVYLDCTDVPPARFGLDPDTADIINGDFTTISPKLFVVGPRRNSVSWITAAYDGRREAESIYRYLQGVSPASCREYEGSYESCLFTDTSHVAPEPVVPMSDPASGYTEEEAALEASRCLQCECLECVKACAYLESFGGRPAKYARDIYNFESVSLWRSRANKLINSCSLCGLCTVVCPYEFPMADVCYKARATLLSQGKMPPSAHDFALQDMLFNNSDKFASARNAPGSTTSAYAFFPGCQLSGSSPEHVKRVYGYLRENLSGGVGLVLRCCGAPADWAQRQDMFRASLDEFRNQWSELGEPAMVVACSTCYKIFKTCLPEIETISLWSMIEKLGLPLKATEGSEAYAGILAVHDPCTTRHEPLIHLSVRNLLAQLGCEVNELAYSREMTQCCGYGGLTSNANPALAREIAARRAAESPLDYVTYCAMCRDNIAAAGKRMVHILDLIYKDPSNPDPAARKGPGYSVRHENRWRLKNDLLREVWGERTKELEDHEKIKLKLAPGMEDRLEQRRILVEDIQRVIDYGEKSGKKLFNPQTKRWLLYYKPVRVTYWVDYTPEGDEFVVHNAYCHRMEILEDRK